MTKWNVDLDTQPVHGGTNSGVVRQLFNRSDCCDSGAPVVDVFVANIPDVLGSNAVNTVGQFIRGQSSAVAQQLAT